LPLLHGEPVIPPAYWVGLSIVPVVTLGYLFNGIYINFLAPITLAKRTDLVAVATGIGAFVNVAANFALIGPYGIMGAAIATLLAYMAMALTLFIASRRIYPIDYEYGRLMRIALCGAIVSAIFIAAPRPLELLRRTEFELGLLAAFPILLALTGFFHADELAGAARLLSGRRPS